MTEWFEDLKFYLPKYLSDQAQKNLFAELSQFPKNIDGRLYTLVLEKERMLFQGDGLSKMWVVDLPDARVGESRVMVLSNSCDIAQDTKRILGPRLLYCPIISFDKYEKLIRSSMSGNPSFDPSGHLEAIRRQHNTSMFFLPKNEALGGESIALLDRINNCNAQVLSEEELIARRIFTLSDYGFYLFLFKISLHLTRIREGVSRN